MIKRDQLLNTKIDQIISTLSKDDAQGIVRFSSSFTASVSKEGFKKLINDEDIGSIRLSTLTGSPTLN